MVFTGNSSNTVTLSESEILSTGIRAVSVVNTSTTAAVEIRNSHVVGDVRGGDLVIVNTSVEGDTSFTVSEVCVGVADLEANTWLDNTCP